MNNKKIWLLIGLFGWIQAAQADILVILPETGALARAGLSIKQGFLSAYQASGNQEPLKFVDATGQNMKTLLSKQVKAKTRLVVGPLDRTHVDALMQANPKVQVLALNESSQRHKNVWQFSLSKQADAAAMAALMNRDKMTGVVVLREPGAETESEIFLISLMSQLDYPVQVIEQLPKKLDKQQALLLLGSYGWLNGIKKLPKNAIYAHAVSIEQGKPIPEGLKFCDVPALYEGKWQDVIDAYQQQPVNMAYQRLLAFGGDVWMLAEYYLQHPQDKNMSFAGRTGNIQLDAQQIQRMPQCYQQVKSALRRL